MLMRKAKVDHDGLGMTNVQITSAFKWATFKKTLVGWGI